MSGRDVDALLAKQEITEIVYRYCRALDRMDRDLALSCWHDGATVDYGDFRGSAPGFLDWVWQVHREVFQAHSHQVANVLIELDADRAVSESYLTVTLRRGTPPDRLVDVVARGRYLDRWSRRAGRWAIDHRQLVTDFRSAYAVLDAGATDPASTGRRDRSDPSYEILDRGTALGVDREPT